MVFDRRLLRNCTIPIMPLILVFARQLQPFRNGFGGLPWSRMYASLWVDIPFAKEPRMLIGCNRGCSNLFQFLRQSSNNGLWILSLIFLLFRATMAYYVLKSSPNTLNWSPSLWGRGSSPLIRLPSFSLMQLFACLESQVVYYMIMMSAPLLHFRLVCGQFLGLGWFCQAPTIPKRMARQNVRIRLWNRLFTAWVMRVLMIGFVHFNWPS